MAPPETNELVNTHFVAGKVADSIDYWASVTNSKTLLQNVQGVQIPFNCTPVQSFTPFPYRLSDTERQQASREVDKFLEMGVITKALHDPNEFISNIFVRPKPNGEARIILDLTKLNSFVQYEHFKMFSLNTAIDLITPGAWMATVDLKQAYYSVSIAEQDRKYLRFNWEGQ